MKIAETVTFGGSSLDRAAHLRGDSAQQAAMLKDDRAKALAIWRGKPLFKGVEQERLVWLAPDDPVFKYADETPVFLGLDDGVPCFAYDISDWDPDAVPDTLGGFADLTLQRHPSLPESYGFGELRGSMSRLSPREAELAVMARGIQCWHQSHGFCARCGAKSEISMAGWQRSCTACNGQHFPRTDPVVIMLITHGNDVLLGRSPGWPAGMYSLLAGFIEPGETIEAAVRREVHEETNVRVGKVGYLASQPWPFPASLMLGCHGEALSRDIKVDPKEIEDAVWINREGLVKVFNGEHPEILPPRQGAIAQFLLENWVADRLD